MSRYRQGMTSLMVASLGRDKANPIPSVTAAVIKESIPVI
jgi:hypothetical protein